MVDMVSRIKLLFLTQGAKGAAKETETVGRAQTRLGQASASAGRQFSAQASGLGGLVAAYAGAAATIFAVTQAFAALNRAAQAEQVIKGTKALALEVGASGDQIIASIQKITKGQLSMAEAATSANIALSAGFGREQIERLTEVSLKASRALGRTLTDAFTRLTRGTAKLEPELLDELGIFVRIEPAVEKYAVSIGKTATALTQFERRQAFVNAAIEEGERKFGIIDTSTESTLESFEKLSATFQDLIRTFGGFAADVISPLVRFFSEGGNAMLLFLGVGRLVFGKAGQLMGGFSTKVTQDIGRFTDKMTAASERTRDFGKATIQAQQDAKGLKHTFAGLGPVGGAKATEARQARGRAQAGTQLSTRQMQADIKTLNMIDKAEQKHRKTLDAKSAAYKRSSERGLAASKIASTYRTAIKSAGIQTRIFAGFANIASLAVKGLTVAMRGLMSVFNIVFMVVGAAQLIGSLFDVDILGGITGWFKELGAEARNLQKAFEGVINAASLDEGIKESLSKRFTQNEIRRIAEDATDIIPAITKSLQDVSVNTGEIQPVGKDRGIPDVFKGISDTQQSQNFEESAFGRFKDVDSNFQQATAGLRELDVQAAATMKNVVMNFSSLYKKGEGAITDLVDKVNKGLGSTALQFKDLGENFDGVREAMQYVGEDSDVMRMRALGLAAAYSQITDQQNDYQEALNKWHDTDRGDTEGREEQEKIMKASKMRMESLRLYIAAAESGRIEVGKMGVALSNLTGVPLNRVIDDLSEVGGVVTRVKNELIFAGESLGVFNISTQQFDNTPAMEKMGAFIGVNIRFVDLQKRVSEAYDKGAISAESMSQKVGGLSALIREASEDLLKQTVVLIKSGMEMGLVAAQMQSLQERLGKLTEKRDELQKLADGLSRVENIGKNLRRIFSKELKLFDDAAMEGLVTAENKSLKWAESSEEIAKNQRDYLKAQFTSVGLSKETLDFVGKHRTGQEALNQADEKGLDVNSLIRKEIENSQTALKAMVGSVPKLTQELVKVKEEIEKIIKKLEGAREVLTLKNELTVLKGALDTLNKRAALSKQMNSESLKYERELLKLQKANEKRRQKSLDFDKQELENRRALTAATSATELAGISSMRGTAERGGAATLGVAQRELAQLERDSALQTAETIRKKREEIINIEYNNAMNILKIDKMQSEIEHREAMAELNMKKTLLTREQGVLRSAIINRVESNATQMRILKAQQGEEVNAMNLREAQLTKQEEILAKEGELAIAAINARYDDQKAQYAIIAARAQNIIDEALMFQNSITGLKEVFNLFIRGVNEQRGLTGTSKAIVELDKTDTDLGGVIKRAETVQASMVQLTNLSEANKQTEITGITEENLRKQDLRREALAGLAVERQYMSDRHQLAITNLNAEQTAEGLLQDQRSEDATTELSILEQQLISRGILREAELEGFRAEADAIIRNRDLRQDALDDERDVLRGLGRTIADNFRGRARTAVSDFVSALNEGTLTMDSFKQGFKSFIVGVMQDIQEAILQELVQKLINKMISDIANNIDFGGFNLFGSKASGGYAGRGSTISRFAAGGGVFQRDRVPALLEPGEFVIRKPMAKAIGGPVLERMNATGQMPAGNIEINMVNKGTPQQATSEQKPQIDGKGIIIDIVLTDLQNNGPIKQAIRGGGRR